MQGIFLPERGCFRVTCITDSGPVSRLMSPGDYASFICAAYGDATGDVEAMPIVEPTPTEFLRGRFDTGIGSGCVAYRLPPGNYPLLFGRDDTKMKHYMVHFPTTIWQIRVIQHKVAGIDVFVVFDEPINDNTMLFRLPLPNCYDDGKICLGANHWTMNKLSDFHEIVGRFFSAPHNVDLFNPGEYGCTVLQLLKKLEKEGITTATAKPVGTFQDCKNRKLLPAFC